jgi:hypothetical protein
MKAKNAKSKNAQTARITAPRELHLIDIENEIGKAEPSATEVAQFRHFYLAIADGWPGARSVYKQGKDGADLALLEVALDEGAAGRFGKVVIASGDHVFTEAVDTLQAHSVDVRVFARKYGTHHTLYTHCRDVRTFTELEFSAA